MLLPRPKSISTRRASVAVDDVENAFEGLGLLLEPSFAGGGLFATGVEPKPLPEGTAFFLPPLVDRCFMDGGGDRDVVVGARNVSAVDSSKQRTREQTCRSILVQGRVLKLHLGQ